MVFCFQNINKQSSFNSLKNRAALKYDVWFCFLKTNKIPYRKLSKTLFFRFIIYCSNWRKTNIHWWNFENSNQKHHSKWTSTISRRRRNVSAASVSLLICLNFAWSYRQIPSKYQPQPKFLCHANLQNMPIRQ